MPGGWGAAGPGGALVSQSARAWALVGSQGGNKQPRSDSDKSHGDTEGAAGETGSWQGGGAGKGPWEAAWLLRHQDRDVRNL